MLSRRSSSIIQQTRIDKLWPTRFGIVFGGVILESVTNDAQLGAEVEEEGQ